MYQCVGVGGRIELCGRECYTPRNGKTNNQKIKQTKPCRSSHSSPHDTNGTSVSTITVPNPPQCMNEQTQYLTQEKYNELKEELEHLTTVRRKEIAESLEYARSLGDLSENAEYSEARDLQAATEARISKIEDMLKYAQILKKKRTQTVTLGSNVTIVKKGEKDEHAYTIVGSEETNMLEGKLSHLSPLGSAMMGKKKGEEFSFETPRGVQKYVIVSVS